MTSANLQPCAPAVDAAGRDLLERHAAWWKRQGMLYSEYTGSPLGDLWLPLADGSVAQHDVDLTPDMLDLERLAGEMRTPGPLETDGDIFRAHAPYARVPWVEAILGCPIRATIQGGSMRSHAYIRDWDDWKSRAPRRSADWLRALTQLTEMLAARSGGRHAVVHTLMRGPSDLAEAILGPEMMSLAMYDAPEELRAFLEEVTQTFIEILEAQRVRTPGVEGGYINPFGIWAPGKVVRTQCDASAFLSPAQYAQWFLPYDERICWTVDYSVIHLHSGSLHTVPELLKVERPQAIQVSIDPPSSSPTVEDLIPLFRQVLAVKPLLVDGPMTREQARRLRDELPHEGLYIRAMWGTW